MTADQPVQVGDLVDVLELVEGDERAIATALVEPQRQVEERVQRRQRICLRVELQLRADAVCPQREADACPLEEALDLGAKRPLQMPGVGALEPDSDVRQRGDSIEIDEDRDQAFSLLAVA